MHGSHQLLLYHEFRKLQGGSVEPPIFQRNMFCFVPVVKFLTTGLWCYLPLFDVLSNRIRTRVHPGDSSLKRLVLRF